MTARERVLAVARAELGYMEKATNDQLDDPAANAGNRNYTKYARDLDALGAYNTPKNGYAWCAVFVLWCFDRVFGLDTAQKMLAQVKGGTGAGCTPAVRKFKAVGRFCTTPEAGDQIFFTNDGGVTSNHTGIVVKIENGRVYTIEGNTSAADGVVANGGAVAEKSYALNDSKIYGYGRPDWSLVETEDEEQEAEDMENNDVFNCSGTGDHPTAWAREAVEYCQRKGIFNGDGAGNYGWQKAITREAVAQIVYNVLEAAGALDKLDDK